MKTAIILLTACKKNQHGMNQCLEPTDASTSSNLKTNFAAPTAIELVYCDSMLVKMKFEQCKGRAAESLLIHKMEQKFCPILTVLLLLLMLFRDINTTLFGM